MSDLPQLWPLAQLSHGRRFYYSLLCCESLSSIYVFSSTPFNTHFPPPLIFLSPLSTSPSSTSPLIHLPPHSPPPSFTSPLLHLPPHPPPPSSTSPLIHLPPHPPPPSSTSPLIHLPPHPPPPSSTSPLIHLPPHPPPPSSTSPLIHLPPHPPPPSFTSPLIYSLSLSLPLPTQSVVCFPLLPLFLPGQCNVMDSKLLPRHLPLSAEQREKRCV